MKLNLFCWVCNPCCSFVLLNHGKITVTHSLPWLALNQSFIALFPNINHRIMNESKQVIQATVQKSLCLECNQGLFATSQWQYFLFVAWWVFILGPGCNISLCFPQIVFSNGSRQCLSQSSGKCTHGLPLSVH